MSLVGDLSKLTTIPEGAFDKISTVLDYIHSNKIVEQVIENKDIIEIELFEGILVLFLEDDTVKYKFIPNKKFESVVIDSIINKKDILVETISERLKNQLLNTYKDIF